MRAEELVALASAHGVDLIHAARSRSALPSRHKSGAATATGRQSYVHRAARWSVAEIGQAAAGVPQVPFQAALYSLAGDRSVYWQLWQALWVEAYALLEQCRWPPKVCGADGGVRFYLEELAKLVLDVDAHIPLFRAAPVMYACCLGVSPKTWDGQLSRRFNMLQSRYQCWISEAMSIMQPRLLEEESA